MNVHRFDGIVRPYTTTDVARLQSWTKIEHSLACLGAERFWDMLHRSYDFTERNHIHALGAMTGNQAVQMVKAGLSAIYASGWQVAADANVNGETYPDQSLYAANSVPTLVKRINNAMLRSEQVKRVEKNERGLNDYVVPIIADAEAGFGGPLNAFELMKSMIEAGAAAVHFEDQLSSAKKCGHLGGKVLVPVSQFIQTLIAARLAADVCDVPTVIIARTDAGSARLITTDICERDLPFIKTDVPRTMEGFYAITGGLDMAIARGLAFAPYADMLWMETSTPDLNEAQAFADAIHAQFPGKLLAYNCSPSFNWSKDDVYRDAHKFQDRLGEMGYVFQFVTLAGYHANALATFRLAYSYNGTGETGGMAAYAQLQDEEFAAQKAGYTAVKHQREASTGYFDAVSEVISGGKSSTLALAGSTEREQF